MLITIHAMSRFAERFPEVKLTIYEALERAVPFGKSDKKRHLLLEREHGILFPVLYSCECAGYVLRTVLTLDQALGDMQLRYLLPREYVACAAKPINEVPLTLEQRDPVVAQLHYKARRAAVEWDYAYPELAQQKAITQGLTAQGFSKKSVIKHYWTEVNKVIYEHNARRQTARGNDGAQAG